MVNKNLRAVLDGFCSILTPPLCIYCNECLEERVIYCNNCLSTISLLDPEERCFRCFASKGEGACQSCSFESNILRKGALFEYNSLLHALYREKQGEKRLIASLFIWQYFRLDWPMFDYVAANPAMHKIGQIVARKYGKPFHRWGALSKEKKTLYLCDGLDRTALPFSVCMSQVYVLSFFLSF